MDRDLQEFERVAVNVIEARIAKCEAAANNKRSNKRRRARAAEHAEELRHALELMRAALKKRREPSVFDRLFDGVEIPEPPKVELSAEDLRAIASDDD